MVITQNKPAPVSKKILEKLRLKKEKIMLKEEIFQIIKEYQKIYRRKVNLISLWTYLRKNNYLRRLLGDYYYIYSVEERYHHYCQFSEEELVFQVLDKMKISWYLGLERALIENKISWQVLNIIPIINSRFSGLKKLGNSRFKFIKTTEKKLTFGLIGTKTNNQVHYFYSDPEKTHLDFLHFSSYGGKDPETIKKHLDFKINKIILRKYARKYTHKIQERA